MRDSALVRPLLKAGYDLSFDRPHWLNAVARVIGAATLLHQHWLTVNDVPYISSTCQQRKGRLHVELDTQGGVVVPPSRHWIWWEGKWPCHADGRQLKNISAALMDAPTSLFLGKHEIAMLSRKPQDRRGTFTNYHQMVDFYAALVGRGLNE